MNTVCLNRSGHLVINLHFQVATLQFSRRELPKLRRILTRQIRKPIPAHLFAQ